MIQVAGIVLAGGRSTRMGIDKASLPWKNTTMLDHAVKSLSDFCLAGVWVAGKNLSYPFFKDFPGVKGPMAAIANLATLKAGIDAFLIVPVDMPFFTVFEAEILIRSMETSQSIDGVCCSKSHLPLLLRNGQRFTELIQSWLRTRQSDSLYSFLMTLKLLTISEEKIPASALINLNHRNEYLSYAVNESEEKTHEAHFKLSKFHLCAHDSK